MIENEHVFKYSNLKLFKPKASPNYVHKYQLTFTIETDDNMLETLSKAKIALSHVFHDYNLSIVEK